MSETSVPATIRVDQFVAAAPAQVWRTLDMPGYGKRPCAVLEADPPQRLLYTFTAAWALTRCLEAEGTGTRVFLEPDGFDPDDKRMAGVFSRMGPGWRDVVLPRLTGAIASVISQGADTTSSW